MWIAGGKNGTNMFKQVKGFPFIEIGFPVNPTTSLVKSTADGGLEPKIPQITFKKHTTQLMDGSWPMFPAFGQHSSLIPWFVREITVRVFHLLLEF